MHCAGVLIFVGMALDAVDGWIARLMNSMSELGGQLDSLTSIPGTGPGTQVAVLVSITTCARRSPPYWRSLTKIVQPLREKGA